MIIEKCTQDYGTVYKVCSDCKENGGREPHEIITCDSFESAVLILKYMRGDRMPYDDQNKAKETIRKEDE